MVTVKLDKNQTLILATEYKNHPWDNIIWWHSNCSQNEIQVHKGAPYLSQLVLLFLGWRNLEKEAFIWLLLLCCGSSEKSQSRKSSRARTEPGKSCWHHCHQGWLFLAIVFMASLACFFIQPNFSSQRMEPPPTGWGWAIPHKPLMRKTPYRFAYFPILCRHFLNWISSSKTNYLAHLPSTKNC